MAFGARELRPKERDDELGGERWSDDARSQRQHVHLIVLHALMRRECVVAERRSNANEFVRRHRRADATAAQQHAAFGATIENGARNAFGEIRVVVTLDDFERTAIQCLVSGATNGVENYLLERKAGVISTHRDDH